MKCKHCNGTGKIRGYFYEKTGVNKWEKVWGDSPCDECNGTGKIEITNEEWLCQLSTGEKAEMLANESKNVINDFENFDFKREHKEFWEMWLKELRK